MFSKAIPHFESDYASKIQQSNVVPLNASYGQIVPGIKMLIGPWYLDEFGNPTRQIKARD
jgi:hypothetical protein